MELETKIIFIDTSIFESQNFLRGFEIKRLGELSKTGNIQLKITDVIYREVLDRMKVNIETTRAIFRKADKELHGEGKILKNLDEFKDFYPMPRINNDAVFEKMKSKLDEFIGENNIEVIPTSIAKIEDVVNQYFKRELPFSDKKKDEFPDAISISIISQWCSSNNLKTYLYAKDGDITLLPSTDKILPLAQVSEFLNAVTKEIEEEIKLQKLEELLENNSELEHYIETNYYDEISYKVYEELLKDGTFYDLEYEPPENIEVEIVKSLITDVIDDHLYAEFEVKVNFDLPVNYTDLSGAIYDKEDGIWFNTEFATSKIETKASYKLYAEFNFELYEDEEDEDFFELEGIEQLSLVKLKYDEKNES